jgi:hypothetical protein
VSESPSYYHFASTTPLGLRVWSRKPSPMPPVTKYVQSGDVGIAYQVMGDGPLDLLIVPSAISHNLGKSAGSRACTLEIRRVTAAK